MTTYSNIFRIIGFLPIYQKKPKTQHQKKNPPDKKHHNTHTHKNPTPKPQTKNPTIGKLKKKKIKRNVLPWGVLTVESIILKIKHARLARKILWTVMCRGRKTSESLNKVKPGYLCDAQNYASLISWIVHESIKQCDRDRKETN